MGAQGYKEEEEEPVVVVVNVHGSDQSPNSLLKNRRCCFCFPWWDRLRSSSSSNFGNTTPSEETKWWSKGFRVFMKIREWSEIVAGPKWKTFIRRFNHRHRGGGGSGNHSRHHGKFQYDPLSYSLNFDEGQNGHFDDEDSDFGGYRNFSSRYASASLSVSASGKPLPMDVLHRTNDVAVTAS